MIIVWIECISVVTRVKVVSLTVEELELYNCRSNYDLIVLLPLLSVCCRTPYSVRKVSNTWLKPNTGRVAITALAQHFSVLVVLSSLNLCHKALGSPIMFSYRGDISSRDSPISLGLYSTTCTSLCVFNAQAAGREPRLHAAGRKGVRTATSLHRMSSDNLRSRFLNVTYWRMVLLLGV